MQVSSTAAARVVYLHVGAMKTGTTYLQQLMYANRDLLAEAGVLVPGERWGRQVRAAQDLLGLSWTDRHIRRGKAGAWEELTGQVRASSLPRAVISVEFLGPAPLRVIRRAVASLAPARVEVVFTVRDMAAVLPALWQTQVHNGARYSWPDFLSRVAHPSRLPRVPGTRHRPEDVFGAMQDVPGMLARWGSVVGNRHLHVVTVPRDRGRPGELWERLATVLGIDPAVAARPAPGDNSSIGLAATELVRQLNRHVGHLPHSEYNATVKDRLALRVLATRAGAEDRARLTQDGYDFALRWNAGCRRAVLATGAALTGDLDDLPVVSDPGVRATLSQGPPPPVTRQLLDDAELAVAALDRMRRRRAATLRRHGIDVPPPQRSDLSELRRAWESADDPVDAAGRSLATGAREAALLLRRLRRIRDADALNGAGAGSGRSRTARSRRSLPRSR